MRQGPHQDAQKSTTNGMSSIRSAFLRVSSESSTGASLTSGAPQVPHLGPAFSRSSGTRFPCPQAKQLSFIAIEYSSHTFLSAHI